MGRICLVAADEPAAGGGSPLRCLHDDPDRCPVDRGQHRVQHDAAEAAPHHLHRGRTHQLPTELVLLACAGRRYPVLVGWTGNIHHRLGVAPPLFNDSRGLL
uniref:(northern house mosquito) hypothetical protein n=2 Tax=Culex pipiens TaxID=7175 RepID=A0A8D8HVA2_CULPI